MIALSSKLGWLLSGLLKDHGSTLVVQANVVISTDVINPTAMDECDTLTTMLRLSSP